MRNVLLTLLICSLAYPIAIGTIICSAAGAGAGPGESLLGQYCEITVVNATSDPVMVEYTYDKGKKSWPAFGGILGSGRSARRRVHIGEGTICLRAKSLKRAGSRRRTWTSQLWVQVNRKYEWKIK